MAYDLDDKIVVGVASSALFDLDASNAVFEKRGEKGYREYQEQNIDETLNPGVAFPFIERLLSLNDLSDKQSPLIEVIILSRNDPETGLRVMRSVKAHNLQISRAIFMQGRSPYKFIGAMNMSLFLSANERDVQEAIGLGFAAGKVVGKPAPHQEGRDLRIAFDFDGVLADDSSEVVMQTSKDLDVFHANETANMSVPLPEGALSEFLRGINRIQDIEEELVARDPSYNRRVHVSIVTARNAPSHERLVRTLNSWGLRVNDAFFLGGIKKARVLRVLKPHIFFDDQINHLTASADEVPSVHVPFGVMNAPKELADGVQPLKSETSPKSLFRRTIQKLVPRFAAKHQPPR